RMKDLGVSLIYQGYRDKRPAFEALIQKVELRLEQVAYVGDDVVDLPIMTQVGLAIAVQDAHPFVKQHAHWITTRSGGRGAVRDVCEMLLEARGSLAEILASYLHTPG
ncbi:MAG: HAD hydrolase family protein, partial [Gammaproteobacteria bacterium]